jgi:hypothetical protein
LVSFLFLAPDYKNQRFLKKGHQKGKEKEKKN